MPSVKKESGESPERSGHCVQKGMRPCLKVRNLLRRKKMRFPGKAEIFTAEVPPLDGLLVQVFFISEKIPGHKALFNQEDTEDGYSDAGN